MGLFLLLVFIPFIEIYLLLSVKESIGWSNTILLIIFTGLLGATLLKRQGHSILMDLQKNSQQGALPTDAIVKGLFTFVGGLMLLTPGILTDFLGFSLILPGTQALWKRSFLKAFEKGVASGNIHVYSNMGQQRPPGPNPFENPIQRPRKMDPSVIDIEASKSETVHKSDD